jgi:S-adenosylmethionine:tRNA ribosyltransferase-isomerase
MKKLVNFAAAMGISIKDYSYDLPDERIALHPLPERDQSRLLLYNSGSIEHHQFTNLANLLPEASFLFFNDTKVIPARILFRKETGAEIEVFLLTPIAPAEIAQSMAATGEVTWKCAVGNAKRWTDGLVLERKLEENTLKARLIDREKNTVSFQWTGNASFAEMVNRAGQIPLPPYLNRAVEPEDEDRYQTVYSHNEGAVAAPTAGLHFTDRTFGSLEAKGIHHDFLTLHVSAGTFQPVKSDNADEHVMHHEQMVVSLRNIENVLRNDKKIAAVGTTSMRTLESLYWYGVQLIRRHDHRFNIKQDDPYTTDGPLPSRKEAFEQIRKMMVERQITTLTGETSIFIKPGYTFRVCDALITNFHQPASTLILLIAAFVGEDWRKIYEEALIHQYRFLSYGDSSLLIPRR